MEPTLSSIHHFLGIERSHLDFFQSLLSINVSLYTSWIYFITYLLHMEVTWWIQVCSAVCSTFFRVQIFRVQIFRVQIFSSSDALFCSKLEKIWTKIKIKITRGLITISLFSFFRVQIFLSSDFFKFRFLFDYP